MAIPLKFHFKEAAVAGLAEFTPNDVFPLANLPLHGTLHHVGNVFPVTPAPQDLGASYMDLGEIGEPAAPVDRVRLFAVDDNGSTRLQYKLPDGTRVQVARDNLIVAKNLQGAAITKGQVCHITGGVGAFSAPEVQLAKADSENTTPAHCIAVEPTLAANDFGRFLLLGKLENFDTSGFLEGDIVYLSATVAGGMTATPPALPNLVQRLGVVLNANPAAGDMMFIPAAIRTPLQHASSHGPGGTDEVTLVASATDAHTVDGKHASEFEVAGAVAAHVAAGDPHTGYQLESEKGAASGYAGLNASTRMAESIETTVSAPGSDHSVGKGAVVESRVAAVDVVFGEVCYRNSAGKLAKAKADAEATTKGYILFAVASISADATGDFVWRGILRDDSWAWGTVGAPLFISAATAGALTLTPPASGNFARVVAYVESATTIMVAPDNVWVEVA